MAATITGGVMAAISGEAYDGHLIGRRFGSTRHSRHSRGSVGSPTWTRTTSSSVEHRKKAMALGRIDYSGVEIAHFFLHCEFCPYDHRPENLRGCSNIRHRIHMLLDDPYSSSAAYIISVVTTLLILASVLAFLLESVQSMAKHSQLWATLECVIVSVFTLEYVLRLATVRKAYRFIFQPLNVIDLLAILPFYIELIYNGGEFGNTTSESEGANVVRVFRIIRLTRVFRLLKMSRHSLYMRLISKAVKMSSDAFKLLLFIIMIAVIMYSSVVYYAEKGTIDAATGVELRSDGSPNPFVSIPATFYWAVATMTTTGYGDLTPVEPVGKFFGALSMISGIMVVALPISILGNNFQAVYTQSTSLKPPKGPKRKIVIKEQVAQLRSHRVQLERIVSEMRYLLAHRSGHIDINQVWTHAENTLLTSLLRIEQFLSRLELSNQTLTSPEFADDEYDLDSLSELSQVNKSVPKLAPGRHGSISEAQSVFLMTEEYENAGRVIQRWFRWRRRQRKRHDLVKLSEKQEAAALIIQRNWRTHQYHTRRQARLAEEKRDKVLNARIAKQCGGATSGRRFDKLKKQELKRQRKEQKDSSMHNRSVARTLISS